ncbi:hypothetical protein [Leptospira meyeri]|uniref:hypothetical protein n=1 Tax=Leptospira meyeri TaxID=29508 RepID=UPI001083A249|nr:hypothetical protein [Leptospira meyeri]TGL12883.1 hypothetical protein EHQ50_14055 [Leptospira meyeri]
MKTKRLLIFIYALAMTFIISCNENKSSSDSALLISTLAVTGGSSNVTTCCRIFITMATYNGNLGGVSGADARKPADGSTYKAFLVDGINRAITIILKLQILQCREQLIGYSKRIPDIRI